LDGRAASGPPLLGLPRRALVGVLDMRLRPHLAFVASHKPGRLLPGAPSLRTRLRTHSMALPQAPFYQMGETETRQMTFA
jgi:hypothetical protein